MRPLSSTWSDLQQSDLCLGLCPGAVALVSVVSGPDCAGAVPLPAGRHVVGRSSSARIRIADVRLGLHHAVLEVGIGIVTVTPLSGEAPIRLGGEPVVGSRTVSLPARISIGMNELQITAAHQGADDRPAGHDVIATPPNWSSSESIAPPRRVELRRAPPATALTGASAALAAGVIAALLRHDVVALVAVSGAVALAVTWLAGAASSCRRNRQSRRNGEIDRQRFLDDLAAARATARARHLLLHVSLARVIATADELAGAVPMRSGVWQHALGVGAAADRPAFWPVVGLGSTRWTPVLGGDVAGGTDRDLAVLGRDTVTDIDRVATIDDVAIPVVLTCGEITAVSGGESERDALVRSIVCQLAVRHGPADWLLVVVSAARPKWSWVGWLPQVHSENGAVMFVDPTDTAQLVCLLNGAERPQRPTLLVVDDSAVFAADSGALRRFVEHVEPATLTTVDAGAIVPDVCHAVITVGSTGAVSTARFDDLADTASGVQMCGLSVERAAHVARLLARLAPPVRCPALGE